MLQEILDYIHNYFVREVYRGTFKIESGSLAVDFLKDGQYFKIVGSVFNDGVHQYKDSDQLEDETFTGQVLTMAVPPYIIELDAEISAWVDANKDVINSPFQSESFGGYSYSKGSGSGKNGLSQISWQDKFSSKLNAYRKIG